MTSFESMYNKMQPLKSYNLEEGSNVFIEISSYAVALDEFRELLDEFLRECFVSTAESYGLDNREILVGEIKSNLSVESRREILRTRNLLGLNDFTIAGMGRFLNSFGITEYDIIEMPEQFGISVYISGDFTAVERQWIRKQIKGMLPAHLDRVITFQNIKWKKLDNNDLTFAEIDNLNYDWKAINNLV